MGLESLAAGILAGGSLLGSVVQGVANKKAIREQQEYNSPVNQVSRLRAAGFNPAHLFGQMNIDAGNQDDIAPVDYSGMIGSASSAVSAIADSAVKEAQKQNIEADTHLKDVQAGLTAEELKREEINNKFLPDVLSKNLVGADLDNAIKQITAGLTQEQINKVRAEVNHISKNMDYIDSQLNIMKYDLSRAKSEAEIADIRAQFTPSMMENELRKQLGEISNLTKYGEQISALVRSIDADTDLKVVQKGIQDIILSYQDDISKYEKSIKQDEATMTYRASQIQKSGQSTAEFMAPVSQFTGALGNIFSGVTHLIKK